MRLLVNELTYLLSIRFAWTWYIRHNLHVYSVTSCV